jgi:hypothetical protein
MLHVVVIREPFGLVRTAENAAPENVLTTRRAINALPYVRGSSNPRWGVPIRLALSTGEKTALCSSGSSRRTLARRGTAGYRTRAESGNTE